MAKYVATIYYSGSVEGEGETEEEAIDNARNELIFTDYDTEIIDVEKCDEEEREENA